MFHHKIEEHNVCIYPEFYLACLQIHSSKANLIFRRRRHLLVNLSNTLLLKILPQVVDQNRGGIYHYCNRGMVSWYDFAFAILDLVGAPCKVLPIKTGERKMLAQRPSFGVLDVSKIQKEFHLEIPYWRDSLKECLYDYYLQSEYFLK